MRFADCTFEELASIAPSVHAVFIPLGCTEQQGPHMTVNCDTLMIERLCEATSDRLANENVTVLVMPTLPYGPTPEHAGFSHGFVNLRQETHEAVVRDILESLAAQGFGRLLVWRGCGQHDLTSVIEGFNDSHRSARAFQPLPDYHAIALTAFGEEVPGGHADSFATSLCLFLDEACVRTERIRKPMNTPFAWSERMDFSRISDTGVIGDPTKASRAAGEKIWSLCVEAGCQIVRDVLDGRPTRESWHFLKK